METCDLFAQLAEKYSLIPVDGKKPIDRGWTRWCTERRPFDQTEFENCNAGIACGPASGVLVLDVDDIERFAELAKEKNWEVPETMTVQTGGGGRHYYYAYPDDGREYRNKSFKVNDSGVFDVRGLGGVTVAPGSVHPDTGKTYSLLNDLEPVPAPAWLLDYCRRQDNPTCETAAQREPQASTVAPSVDVDVSELRVSKATKQIIQAGAPKGSRSEQQWLVIMDLLRAGYEDDTIVAVFEKYAIGEKYRSKGTGRMPWLRTDIDRARAELPKAPHQGGNSPENVLDVIMPHVKGVIRDGANNYVRCESEGNLMTLDLTGSHFSSLMEKLYYGSRKAFPAPRSVQVALNILKLDAMKERTESKVHLRMARVNDKVYLDLADHTWSVVEISAEGWQILPQSPVPMWRAGITLPLPRPVEGGSLDELRELVNCPEDHFWSLVEGFLISATKPDGPYFLLNVLGSPGSGKSGLARLLKLVLDPSASMLSAFPGNLRDLMISAKDNHILTFDNLSSIPQWASDALCRMCTGGSINLRSLYTNGESYVIDAKRPIILTGINSVIGRSDLADRTITIDLPTLQDSAKKLESEIMRNFQAMHPRILGAVCTAISRALANESRIQLPSRPRMLDATTWICASKYDPEQPGFVFLDAILGNRREVAADLIRENPVAEALVGFMGAHESNVWEGSATALLQALQKMETAAGIIESRLPQQPNRLSAEIKQCVPILNDCGISYDSHRVRSGSLIKLTKINGQETMEQPEPSTSDENNSGNTSGFNQNS